MATAIPTDTWMLVGCCWVGHGTKKNIIKIAKEIANVGTSHLSPQPTSLLLIQDLNLKSELDKKLNENMEWDGGLRASEGEEIFFI